RSKRDWSSDVCSSDLSGNYTCTIKSRLNEKSNVVQKYYHQLVIISTPIYKVITNLIYDLREPCELSDGDVISMYLPRILEGLLRSEERRVGKECRYRW